MKKTAVLFGGPSPESGVSSRSAKGIMNALQTIGYNPQLIEYETNICRHLKDFDTVFNIMHGKPGEDGIVQGMLENINIPYTGSGVIASALTINKYYTQTVLKSIGIPTLRSLFINSKIFTEDRDIIKKNFEKKIILKPNTGGSSVGTQIISPSDTGLIEDGLEEYDAFIAEEYAEGGQEITVGVIEENGIPRALTPLELRPRNVFYDYEAKYTKGMTQFILPPELDGHIIEELKHSAVRVFEYLNLKSFARVDFIVRSGSIYELEVNSVPGMTDVSDLPAEAEFDAIDYNELVKIIMQTAGVNKDA